MRRLIRQIDAAIPLLARVAPLHGPPEPRKGCRMSYPGHRFHMLCEPPHPKVWSFERQPRKTKYGNIIDPTHEMAHRIAWMRDRKRELHEALGHTQSTWGAVHPNLITATPGGQTSSKDEPAVGSNPPVASIIKKLTQGLGTKS